MHAEWQHFLDSHGALIESGRLINFPEHGTSTEKTRDKDSFFTDLSPLALIEISGNDAEDFLHGQFTTNIKKLSNHQWQFSAWCNPKGQVRVTFYIYRHDPGFILLIPAELKASFVKQLQIYTLRSEVKITDKSDELIRLGVQLHDPSPLVDFIDSVPEQPGDITISRDTDCLQLYTGNNEKNLCRYILIGTIGRQMTLWKKLRELACPAATTNWELQDIKAAIPWISEQTTEKFLPQMLNLDLIAALDYQKGCYPGQEIIARLHFRGQLKRKMYLATCYAESCTQAVPESGSPIYADDNHVAGTVINVQVSTGKYYFLAIIENDSITSRLSLGGTDSAELCLHQLPYGTDHSQD